MGISGPGGWAIRAAAVALVGSLASAGSMAGQATEGAEPLPEHEEIMAYAGAWDVVVDGRRVGSATARGRVGERLIEFELQGDLGPVSRVSYLLGFDRRHLVVSLDSTWTTEGREAPISVRFETRFVDTRTPERGEIPFLAFALRRAGSGAPGAEPADEVGRVALDYLDAFYRGDDELLRRAVHPDVSKLGFYRETVDQRYQQVPMPFDEMLEFAEAVRAGRVNTPADAPRDVTVLDVADQTAVAQVDAWWGHDYLHLARFDGRWMIIHVLWQSPLR